MSTDQIAIKHNKHRIHPCPNEKKLALLNMLLSQNSGLSIVVALSDNNLITNETITEPNVSVLSDEELAGMPELRCELLISYDLPQSAELYIARLSKTTDSAIVLLDISEQNNLYPIETLLGRVIRQEVVSGFEYPEQPKMKIAPKPSLKPKSDAKIAQRKPFDKPKYGKKLFDKQKSERPKREDDGSERKPFDKPKYDKPKRDGEKSERKPFDKPKYDKKPFEKSKYDKPKKEGESSERKPFDKPKREGESSERKPFDKPKREGEKPKYDKKPNKFLGKDENGKAKFSGKSGERNHRYDGKPKESVEAPKKEGRKISIKALKPKEDSKPSS